MSTATREYKVIGKEIPKVGAVEMVRGEAAYGADIHLPGMLYGKVLRSPYAHARIKRIDASKALALAGVKAVVTGQDMPPIGAGATFPIGEVSIDLVGVSTLVLARDKALFHGHPIAAVAAIDPWVVEEALDLIEVEYEELTPVVDLEKAMKEDSPIIDPELYTKDSFGVRVSDKPSNIAAKSEMGRGDVEKGFAEADVVIEGSYRSAMAHQGYIEPPAATAKVEPDGQTTIWTTTQGSFAIKMQIVRLLDIPPSKVKVVPMEVGGAFGGKIYTMLEPLAVVLSRKSGRPVKIVITREEVLRATGPGSPALFRVRTGCKRDGTITAIDCWMAYDAGCIPGSPMEAAMETSVAAYGKVSNVRLEGYDVITNKTRVHAYRAPGAPQAGFAVEQNINMMAEAISMDPIEFRLKNASEEGDPQANDQPFGRIGLRTMLERMKVHPHWNSRLEGDNRGRGVAVGYWFGATFTSTAHITLNLDGTASLVVGSVDITGTRTALLQIAAEELGLKTEDMHISVGDTETAGYTDCTGGSRTTYTMGAAVYKACQDVLAQLRSRASTRLQAKEEELELVDGHLRVIGSPDRLVPVKDLVIGADGAIMGRGSISRLKKAPAFSANIADVLVDFDTGKVTILRYTTFQDAGKAISPARVEAQMQGGALQGIGWAMTEEYIFSDKGVMRNASLLDYREPVSLDVPMIDAEIIEVPAPDGPYGVRGVGEAPIVPPPATLANAIADATGVRMREMPMTAERVFWALHRNDK